MNIIRVTPQGYCYGVVRAINIAKKASTSQPKPIYVLGDIVHNELVSTALKNLDIITVESKHKTREELIDEIDSGTVIFTAHGISPIVRKKAQEKNLNVIDATCPEVMKTQNEITQYLEMDYHVIFVGVYGHPEAEACFNINKEKIQFVYDVDSLNKIDTSHNKYLIKYQSTLNLSVVKEYSSLLEARLNDKVLSNNLSVCEATTSRQEAVEELTDVDMLIVVGDQHSNNSNKLVEIATKKLNIPSKLILSISDLDLNTLKGVENLAVTSGASTPPELTLHIIDFLESFNFNDKSTWNYTEFSISNLKILGNSMKLIRPSIHDKTEVEDLIRNFYEEDNTYGSLHGANFYSGTFNFESWLEKNYNFEHDINIGKDLVPSTQFLVHVDETIVGFVNIRHKLNDSLRRVGGHIGYSIGKNYRRKGYATSALKLALKECKKLGITDVVVSCDIDNIASAKVIENCNGVLDSIETTNGKDTKRYNIKI